jgi:hypothetical protein
MITKTIVKDELNKLKKYGWRILTMNSNRYIPTGFKYWPDHTLVHPDVGIVFLEVKLYKDIMSEGQKNLSIVLNNISQRSDSVFFYEINENNYKGIIKRILEYTLI